MTDIDLQDTDPAEASGKAATLIESLPWLRRFSDQIIVIKYGGNAMVSDELQDAFAADIAYLRYVGVKPVVVHGGGPQISSMLDRLAIPSEFKGGYRVTSTEAISVVRMVLTGQINPQLVAKINAHGPHATGLSGEDAGLFGGRRRGVIVDGVQHDLGRVGDVVEVDPQQVHDQLAAGRIPVVSSIAPDLDHPGHSLNVNADAAAAALAIALGAAKLVVLTDVPGLYADWPNRDSLVSHLTTDRAARDAAEARIGHDPEDAGVPGRGRGRRRDGGDHRRARAALGARGDLHQQGNRNGSGARMSWQDDAGRDLVRSFGPRMAMFVRGEGAYLWDADGRRYLDFLAGIAVNSLGHAHPVFVEAIANQAATLAHVSNYFATPPQLELASRLKRLAGTGDSGRVYFGNSGAEANEAAFKLARLHGAATNGGPGARGSSP